MKFSIGYPMTQPCEGFFVDLIKDYQEYVEEIYFPWVQIPSGRFELGTDRVGFDWQAQARLERDLKSLRALDVRLDLLLNANCYGERSISCHLENEICGIIQHLENICKGVDIVTTCSPTIAYIVRKQFSEIEIRASVNMRIGTIQAMTYLNDRFDSYVIQRDIQRNLNYVRELADWCSENDKGLCMLANSGCLRYCPDQVFHDNLVAHQKGVDQHENIPSLTPYICWQMYQYPANWAAILQATWVRPEDLCHYEDIIRLVKLSSRTRPTAEPILKAYSQRHWDGNLLNLLDPNFLPAFQSYGLRNEWFPKDWFQHTSTCDFNCHICNYCTSVLKQTLYRFSGEDRNTARMACS